MKKGIVKFLSSLVLGVSLLGAPALGSAEACCPYCDCHYSYCCDCCDCCCCDCCCDYYTIEHPGYYTTERKVTYISNPDVAVYDAFGRFVCYEAVPDTEVVSYVDVWHDGYTEVVYY